jgi:acetyl-CoA carboxylase biotin carboxylase subunit
LRIARACHAVGAEAVAVVSEADRGAPWLDAADAAVCIGPARSDGSYLDAGAVLQAAEQTGCQAIHPGYGFLSENAVFAARCEQQGITFIGPGAEAIRRMGDKAEAKRTAAAAGLPTIPGSPGVLAGPAQALELARRIGFPVLLKATAGGGGKGMRLCRVEAELERALGEAALEAEKAFGNPGLYLEKYIEAGRHVEFQVLCDAFGAAVHVGERECSVQRNHQKLIEESPSPAMAPAERRQLGAAVARAAASFGYRNAGTVEFLRAPDGAMYFMEMNTRLQVEHPVTEMVYGVDLVAEQLRIAALHPLALAQASLEPAGHAIELRINAEDPDQGFRPDPGTIAHFEPPASDHAGVRVRWDSAVRSGYRIPPYYDSLIGKLIVHAPDRGRAIAAAVDALGRMRLDGVKTTAALHRRILDDAAFRSGAYDVGLLAGRGLLRSG